MKKILLLAVIVLMWCSAISAQTSDSKRPTKPTATTTQKTQTTVSKPTTQNGLKSGDIKTFTVDGIAFNMIYVEGGTFTMGDRTSSNNSSKSDEKPAHLVKVNSFYIGQTEVTQALWTKVMGSNPSYFQMGSEPSYLSSTDNLPVETVSWQDCQIFIIRQNALLARQLNGKR